MTIYCELSSAEVTTRRIHQCEWCDETVEKGAIAQFRKYILDDEFWGGWMHPECWAAMCRVDTWRLEEGWSPGEFGRGMSEATE